jgi:hypothetical protein
VSRPAPFPHQRIPALQRKFVQSYGLHPCLGEMTFARSESVLAHDGNSHAPVNLSPASDT